MIRRLARKILPAGSRQRIFAGKVKQRLARYVYGDDLTYRRWIRNCEQQSLHPSIIKHGKKISIIVPTFNTPKKYIKELIDSVIKQSYQNWQLCLADGSTDNALAATIKKLSEQDTRITYIKLETNQGISENTNQALRHTKGEFIGFLDHDDTLAQWALNEVAHTLKANAKADLLYSDEDKLSANGKYRSIPFFKPDWSPDLLLGTNYMAHFVVVKKNLVNKVGGLRRKHDGSQDYDFLLRLLDYNPTIVHIPKVLYHWRMAEGSTARAIGEKSYADRAGRDALKDYLRRNHIQARVIKIEDQPTNYRLYYLIKGKPLASIIIPFKDKPQLLKACVTSILQKTNYANYEIILVSNNSTQKKTHDYLKSLAKYENIKIVSNAQPFNYSAVNNFGRKQASGKILIFLNNDTKIISNDWLDELVGVSLQPATGAVGPMLLYPDKTIQHAGVVIQMTGMAGHVFRKMKPGTLTPFGISDWPRNYLAVTGACLVVEAKKFDEVKGFNEDFVMAGSDVTLCLDLFKKGYRNVYWPYVKLFHYESKSVGSYQKAPPRDYELSLIHYQPYLKQGDPFYNQNLDTQYESPQPRKKYE